MLLSIAQQPYRKVSKLAGSPYGIYITVCSPPNYSDANRRSRHNFTMGKISSRGMIISNVTS